MYIHADFGVVLKNLRHSFGLTQATVAKRLHVAMNTVAGWENNFKYPSIRHLIELAKLFRVPLNYLIGIQKEKSISLEGLTDQQKSILTDLVYEFANHDSRQIRFTQKQKELLADILDEFCSIGETGKPK